MTAAQRAPVASITLEPTTLFVHVNGACCRVWQGHTAAGVPIHAHVALVGVDRADDASELEAALTEVATPRPELADLPPRLVVDVPAGLPLAALVERLALPWLPPPIAVASFPADVIAQLERVEAGLPAAYAKLLREALGAAPGQPIHSAALLVLARRADEAPIDQVSYEDLRARWERLNDAARPLELELQKRERAIEADRKARGVEWCEEGEHEVRPDELIASDEMAICQPCAEAAAEAFAGARVGHSDYHPGARLVGNVCDWQGLGADAVFEDDDPLCPVCHEVVGELLPADETGSAERTAGRDHADWDAEQRARGADPARLRDLADDLDEGTYRREVLGEVDWKSLVRPAPYTIERVRTIELEAEDERHRAADDEDVEGEGARSSSGEG